MNVTSECPSNLDTSLIPAPLLIRIDPYGTRHDTSEFAITSISCWWNVIVKNTFPVTKRIYITRDGGGSNSSRRCNWKYELQQLANDTELEIIVFHYPPNTSKWNKVEHRIFCYISKHWQGQPLFDIETVISLISNTTTEKGLTVTCQLDEKYMKLATKYLMIT